jgi:hypothetical protein
MDKMNPNCASANNMDKMNPNSASTNNKDTMKFRKTVGRRNGFAVPLPYQLTFFGN